MSRNGNPSAPYDHRPPRVYLTGFMGAGKSTVGPILAETLGWSFLDTDHWIEKTTGISVPQWILKSGEREFRRLESRAIQEMSNGPRQVIALGGGALLSVETLAWVKSQGWIIYLKAEVDSLVGRLSERAEQRPLLKKSGDQLDRGVLLQLFRKREVHYQKADISIDTDGKDPGQIAGELREWILRKVGS